MQQFEQGSDSIEVTEELLRRKSAAQSSRRTLLQRAGLMTAAVAGASLMSGRRQNVADAAEVATFKPTTGKGFKANVYDILNFALNLEYLEASLFCHVGYGEDINEVAGHDITSGTGEAALVGTLPTTPNGFVSPANLRLAQEIAQDEVAHIQVLRTLLGTRAVGRPAIDLPGAFSKAYASLNLTNSNAPTTFDVFSPEQIAGDAGFLIGAFATSDVGTTAYNGAAVFLSGQVLADASSILAAECYHVGAARYALYNLSISYPGTVAYLPAIANALAAKEDAASAQGNPTPPPTTQPLTAADGTPYFVNNNPTTGLVYARNFAQVLNIVYQSPGATPTPGGFFPNGLNGRIR